MGQTATKAPFTRGRGSACICFDSGARGLRQPSFSGIEQKQIGIHEAEKQPSPAQSGLVPHSATMCYLRTPRCFIYSMESPSMNHGLAIAGQSPQVSRDSCANERRRRAHAVHCGLPCRKDATKRFLPPTLFSFLMSNTFFSQKRGGTWLLHAVTN